MSWVATAVVGSAVVGGAASYLAADKAAGATESAANQAAASSADQLAYQKELMAPYQKVGAEGLSEMYDNGGFDLMKDPYSGQTLQLPSYQNEYTDKLGAYEEDPGTKAQRALGTKAMAQQEQQRVGYSTPGASASRAAELSQKYDVSGYNTYKNDLANRYNALQGEFATKRSMTADRYNQLTQKMNLGLGATSTLGAAGQTNAANQAQAATQAGQAQAGLWSGLGSAAVNTVNTGIQAYNYGNNAGWFGGGSSPTIGTNSPAYDWGSGAGVNPK